jgi:hypothetical protein
MVEKELGEAKDRIALLENQVRFKTQIIKDSREVLETCVEVVRGKDDLLRQASAMLEDLLDKADNIDEIRELIKKI